MEEESISKEGKPFLKRLILIVVFLTITPLMLLASAASLIALSNSSSVLGAKSEAEDESYSGAQIYASLPATYPAISGQIIESDARPDILKNFLKKYNSPLEPLSQFIVQTSDKHQLDYRLITAIAMKESGLCKIIPEGSHNCWGWGIHSAGTLGFDSFEEGIETVSLGLKKNYIDKGYITVEEIMQKYAHPDSTTWAEGVLLYMDQMK